MKDINNIKIQVGQTVKSTQEANGLMAPAPSQIGTVVLKDERLCIEFYKNNHTFKSYILLESKINEILT